VGDCRVGCKGRRSPGRSGGRAPGVWGRGRWKIGLPGSGRPGAGRAVAPSTGGGALYTGRGPVCGMITRGLGAPETGAGGFIGAGGGGASGFDAAMIGLSGGGTGGATRGGAAAAGGTAGADATGVAGATTGGLGGTTTAAGGREAATVSGVTSRGCGGSTAGLGGAGAAGLTATGAAGLAAGGTGGTAFGSERAGGCAIDSFCCVMARSTSPGREIWERSILVLIASSPRAARDDLEGAVSSAWARRCLRTSSASKSSSELECVFFSVTPTSGRVSRIALLLTSNSRARSLIRILLIRYLVPLRCRPKFACLASRTRCVSLLPALKGATENSSVVPSDWVILHLYPDLRPGL
jgi:hypothetical protein